MSYFTQVVTPMVEEALYINEILNQMRKYIQALVDDEKKETGPWQEGTPTANLDKEGQEQEISQSNKDYKRDGYTPKALLREAGAPYTYVNYMNHKGQDKFLGTSVLEVIRREANSRGDGSGQNKFWVTFGAFVRTDQPAGDPGCDGARMSMEFAQQIIDDTGHDRARELARLQPTGSSQNRKRQEKKIFAKRPLLGSTPLDYSKRAMPIHLFHEASDKEMRWGWVEKTVHRLIDEGFNVTSKREADPTGCGHWIQDIEGTWIRGALKQIVGGRCSKA